jgi:hypothetical protein
MYNVFVEEFIVVRLVKQFPVSWTTQVH